MQNYYWVHFGKLLAGGYPLFNYDDDPYISLREILDIGITYFLNFTEKGEKNLPDYASYLTQVAALQLLTVKHKRVPIPDYDVPSIDCMQKILRTLRDVMKSGNLIYMHCFAGLGRTATVAGCYFVEQGMTGDEALTEIKRVQQGTNFGEFESPITIEQREFVRQWNEHRCVSEFLKI